MKAYADSLDQKERNRNYFNDGIYATDETRHMFGAMDESEYTQNSINRSLKMMEKSEKINANKTVVTGHYYEETVVYEPVGLTLIDEEDNYAAHLFYKEFKESEFYLRDRRKRVTRTFRGSSVYNSCDVIKYMWKAFTFGDIDPIASKAANFSEKEWAYWVYAFFYKKMN